MVRPLRFALAVVVSLGIMLPPLTAEAGGKQGNHSAKQGQQKQVQSQKKRAAASHSPLKPRSAYTQAERDRIFEIALQICKNKFGQPSRVYRVDYTAGKVWCEPPGF